MRNNTLLVIAILVGSIWIALLGLSPVATAKVTGDNCIETEHGTWCHETVLTDTEKFDGVAVGDGDNDGIDDVIGVGLNGKVWMASKKNGEWFTKVIWENPGELLIPAVGDADNDGQNEIVVVGMIAGPESDTGGGQATIIEGSGNHWTATRIFEDTHMLHGVAIGDVDPDHPGNEVVVGGFNYNMTLLTGSGTNWKSEHMFTAEHKIRTVVIGDMDGDGQNEVVAASKDTHIYIVDKQGGAWVNQVVWTDTAKGPARCGLGDYDGDGNLDIVAGGDPKNFAFIKRTGTVWSGEIIWEDSDKIRGAWISDVYDGHIGNELISGGYSGNVTIHFQDGGAWKHVLVFHDNNRLHHVITGDVDPDLPGLEIITAGYSNKVIVIGQYYPDFEIELMPKGVDVVEETSVNFKLTVTAVDFYTDEIDIKVEGLPTGASTTFSQDPIILSSAKAITTITISVPSTVANGKSTFTVKATGEVGTKTIDGYINVDRRVQPTITGPSIGSEIIKGQSVTYICNIENKGNVPDAYNIEVTSSNGFVATPSLKKTSTLQPGESVNVTVTLTVPKDTKAKSDVLTMKAKSNYDNIVTDSASVTTTIKKAPQENGPSFGVIITLVTVGFAGMMWKRRKKG